MISRGERHRAPISRALFGLVCLIALVVLPSTRSSAHAELLTTTPSPGADLATSPPLVRVVFNEGVRPVRGGLRLVREDGVQISMPAARSVPNGFEISVPKLEPGAYVFGWRVVSDDGHPMRGAFTFRVGSVGDQDIAASLARTLLAGESRDTVTGGVYNAARMFRLVATFSIIGLAAMFLILRGKVFRSHRFIALLRLSIVVGILSELAILVLYGPFVSGRTISAVTDGTLLDDTLHDPLGRVAAVRLVCFLALATVWATRSTATGRLHVLFASAVAAAMAATQLIPGHATVGMWSRVSTVSTFLHVVAAGIWIGGLGVLGVAVLHSTRIDRIATARSYSRVATVSLVVVLATGAFSTARQVGSLRALTSTTFGRILIVKLVLVAVTILFGLRNRRRLPSMSTPTGEASVGFRRGVIREASFSMTIVVATVLLGAAQPARDAVRVPVSATIETAQVLVDITVEPSKRRGTYEIHLYSLKPDGLPSPVESMRLFASLPDKQVERLPVIVRRAGSNHFEATRADLSVPGNWRFEVQVSLDEFTEISGSTLLEIR